MDRPREVSRWMATGVTLGLAAWLAAGIYGVPARLVWGAPRAGAAPTTDSQHQHAIQFAPAPTLAPIPMRYAPGRLPDGLRESRRSALVSGSPSTHLQRVWVPEGSADLDDTRNGLTELADPDPPYLTIDVEYVSSGIVLDRALHDAVGELGGYQGSGDSWGFGWDPEPRVSVRVSQRGLGLDRATMYRIARSMHPVADEFTFPLQARQLPVGLTRSRWDSYVFAVVRPDPRSGGWSGSVNWCFALEITVDGTGPPEAAAADRWRPLTLEDRWRPLPVPGPRRWYGIRPLGDGMSKALLALEKRPGTVVTVSTLQHSGHEVSADDLLRIAASVEVPA